MEFESLLPMLLRRNINLFPLDLSAPRGDERPVDAAVVADNQCRNLLENLTLVQFYRLCISSR